MKIPSKISKELAEEVGWHIGDGSMNFYNNRGKKRGFYQLRGHIEDDERHYLERIKPIFEKLYDHKINIRKMHSTRVIGFQIWNDDLINFKKELGLTLGKKFNIQIPQQFLNEKKLLIAVLRGIFDTDGGIYLERKNQKLYPRMYITTISQKLAQQLLETLNLFGLRTTMHSQYYPRGMNRKRSYVIVIRGVEMFHKFMKIIQPKNPKHQEKYFLFLNSKTFK